MEFYFHIQIDNGSALDEVPDGLTEYPGWYCMEVDRQLPRGHMYEAVLIAIRQHGNRNGLVDPVQYLAVSVFTEDGIRVVEGVLPDDFDYAIQKLTAPEDQLPFDPLVLESLPISVIDDFELSEKDLLTAGDDDGFAFGGIDDEDDGDYDDGADNEDDDEDE